MSDISGSPVSGTHTFIIRLWAEEVQDEGSATYRGSITNVMTNEKRYFIRPAALPGLIAGMASIDKDERHLDGSPADRDDGE